MEYQTIIVESYYDLSSGLHGPIHVRPLPGQDPFLTTMRVECSHEIINDYNVGSQFEIRAKITSREGGTPFIYSHYKWPFKVVKEK